MARNATGSSLGRREPVKPSSWVCKGRTGAFLPQGDSTGRERESLPGGEAVKADALSLSRGPRPGPAVITHSGWRALAAMGPGQHFPAASPSQSPALSRWTPVWLGVSPSQGEACDTPGQRPQRCPGHQKQENWETAVAKRREDGWPNVPWYSGQDARTEKGQWGNWGTPNNVWAVSW